MFGLPKMKWGNGREREKERERETEKDTLFC